MYILLCFINLRGESREEMGEGKRREERERERERENGSKQKKEKNMCITRFQPTKKMRIETAVYTMHKRWVALKMSFKHRQETREYTDT